jgi:selenocysteine-specific elongation factor
MLAALTEVAQGGPEAQVAALVELSGVRGETEASLAQCSALPLSVLARALRQLLASGRLRKLGTPPRLLAPPALVVLEDRILAITQDFHAQSPHRAGIEPDQLHRLVGGWLDASAVGQVAAGLVKRGRLEARGAVLVEAGFQPKVTVTAPAIDAAVRALASAGLTPPSQAELAEQLGVEARELAASLQAGQAAGRLVRLPGEDWITTEVAREAVDRVIEIFADRASFTTGELKELLGLTRKYLIPFAEHLDAERITVRDPSGNRRIRDKARDAWRTRTASSSKSEQES